MTARPRVLAGALLAAALIVTVAIIATSVGGDDRYRLQLLMPTAEGIRKNSDVRVGGVTVGKVKDLELSRRDTVKAELDLDRDKVTVGRGASVQILAVNLLGEKYVALDPGDVAAPVASGASIPSSRITPSVDLDQVLDVLDADTRTRLRILINEAGIALAGKGTDLNRMLAEFPGGIGQATELLNQIVSDNHTLGEVVDHAEGFVARVNAQKRDLQRVIDTSAGAASTFAARTAALRETLAQAPGALASLRGFVRQLQTTSAPLGKAADNLAAAAPPLDQTLAALPAFQRAAVPTLRQATDAAPQLTRLGVQATPVIRRSVPTLASFARFVTATKPVSKTLADSIDDLLGILEGWGRAIQARDGLSHIFHGQVSFGANALQTLIDELLPATKPKKERKGAKLPKLPAVASKPADGKQPALPDVKKTLEDVTKLPTKVTQAVKDLVDGLVKPKSGSGAANGGSGGDAAQGLLDYLLQP